ncbi:MAG TPA: HAMP domain-containing histidine kinase [Nitrospirae bacterium]|nr:HAMP domain-containing histidine kinase [Nitrospirota bacterium]
MTESFRVRITLLYTFSASIFLACILFLAFHVYRSVIIKGLDSDLLSKSRELVHSDMKTHFTFRRDIIQKGKDSYIVISNNDGRVSITSTDSVSRSWNVNYGLLRGAFNGRYGFETANLGGEPFRILYLPIDKNRILRTGMSLEGVYAQFSILKIILLISGFLFSLSVGVIGYFVSGRAVKPVLLISDIADRLKYGLTSEKIKLNITGVEIERLLTVLNGMLENIHRQIENHRRFTSDVSHEIRSPLTALRGSMEVALRRTRTSGEYEDLLRRNLQEVNRLQRIAENLLLLSRADYNIIELKKQWFDVNELLTMILERHNSDIISKSLTLIESYREPLEIYGDYGLWDEALNNLVDNSLKYSPDGGTVIIETKTLLRELKISFADNGPGIPEAEREKIFERFYRLDKARARSSGGSGLGLAITKWIIESHNGKIMVDSHSTGGSIFSVFLPLQSPYEQTENRPAYPFDEIINILRQ